MSNFHIEHWYWYCHNWSSKKIVSFVRKHSLTGLIMKSAMNFYIFKRFVRCIVCFVQVKQNFWEIKSQILNQADQALLTFIVCFCCSFVFWLCFLQTLKYAKLFHTSSSCVFSLCLEQSLHPLPSSSLN